MAPGFSIRNQTHYIYIYIYIYARQKYALVRMPHSHSPLKTHALIPTHSSVCMHTRRRSAKLRLKRSCASVARPKSRRVPSISLSLSLIHTHTHAHSLSYTDTHIRTHSLSYTHTCTHSLIHTYMHTHPSNDTHTHRHTHIHTYIHTYIYTHLQRVSYSVLAHRYTCASVHICMHAYLFTYTIHMPNTRSTKYHQTNSHYTKRGHAY